MTDITNPIDRLAGDPRVQEAKLARRVRRFAFFTRIDSMTGPETTVDDRPCINLASNNYLGLASNEQVIEAAREATACWGAGVTGSRVMNGNLALHDELEHELAQFYEREAALVFSTGYAANLGLLSTLLSRGELAYVDEEMHASVLDGVWLAQCRTKRFAHNNAADFKKRIVPEKMSLAVIEGVYSMRGDTAPVADFVRIAAEANVPLIVDEAHGLGTVGARGRGASEEQGCLHEVPAITVTFSKSLGSCGGAVIGDRRLIEALKLRARPFLFTASNTPASLGAALAALRLLVGRPEMVAEVNTRALRLRTLLSERGVEPLPGTTPVVAIEVGEDFTVLQAWRLLLNRGVFTNAVLPPAVPKGRGLLRLSLMRTHTDEMLVRAADACAAVVGELKQLSQHSKFSEVRA